MNCWPGTKIRRSGGVFEWHGKPSVFSESSSGQVAQMEPCATGVLVRFDAREAAISANLERQRRFQERKRGPKP